MTKPVPGGIGISHYHPHPNVARSRRFTAHSGLRCAPSFVVSPSGLRRRVSRGRQIVPCTSAYAHSAPPGGRLPKRSGSASVTNCLSALQAPPTPRLTLHSDFYAPKEDAPSGLHFTQSRHTSDIPPALHRDYTLSTRYTGRRGASKVVSIVNPPGRWKSARFTHTFLRPPSDCLHPRSSEVSWVVGCALLHLRLTTATVCRHKDCVLRLVATYSRHRSYVTVSGVSPATAATNFSPWTLHALSRHPRSVALRLGCRARSEHRSVGNLR